MSVTLRLLTTSPSHQWADLAVDQRSHGCKTSLASETWFSSRISTKSSELSVIGIETSNRSPSMSTRTSSPRSLELRKRLNLFGWTMRLWIWKTGGAICGARMISIQSDRVEGGTRRIDVHCLGFIQSYSWIACIYRRSHDIDQHDHRSPSIITIVTHLYS